jgi:drug/metabolite transporter (DMT)-like permease
LLIVVSLLWGLSFGLIRRYLAGVDSGFVALVRLVLAFLVLVPALRLRGLAGRQAALLAGIGFVQFGLMYVAYQESFRTLEAYQVALFTVFTPIWVTLLNDALARRFHARALAAAALAVAGTAVIVFRGLGDSVLLSGFALVQFSNLCFAIGQVGYARLMPRLGGRSNESVFALLYAGGMVAAGAAFLARGTPVPSLTGEHLAVLGYLGVVASGVGFLLWNSGARLVNAGALAVMNNLKVPLGVGFALVLFGEQTHLVRLLAGGAVIALALWLNGSVAPDGPRSTERASDS